MRKYKIPTMSASIQPIGIDHQIAMTPSEVFGARRYESSTLVPKEIMVKTSDISAFCIPL